MRTPEPIGQQGRWLDFLAEFDLEILHHAGKNHSNSDALSRRPCERGTTTDCPQCIRGTTVGTETAAGHGDDNPTQQTSSSDHTGSAHRGSGGDKTQGEVKSILSPKATPFYPANASTAEIAESQESVFALPTCQNIFNEMSKLQGLWPYAADLSNLLLCCLLRPYCKEMGYRDYRELMGSPTPSNSNLTWLLYVCVYSCMSVYAPVWPAHL